MSGVWNDARVSWGQCSKSVTVFRSWTLFRNGAVVKWLPQVVSDTMRQL